MGRRANAPSLKERLIETLGACGPLTQAQVREVMARAGACPVASSRLVVRTANEPGFEIQCGVMERDGVSAEVFYAGGVATARAFGIAPRPASLPLTMLSELANDMQGIGTLRTVGDAIYPAMSSRELGRALHYVAKLLHEKHHAIELAAPRLPSRRGMNTEPTIYRLTDVGREMLEFAGWLISNGGDVGNWPSFVSIWRSTKAALKDRAERLAAKQRAKEAEERQIARAKAKRRKQIKARMEALAESRRVAREAKAAEEERRREERQRRRTERDRQEQERIERLKPAQEYD